LLGKACVHSHVHPEQTHVGTTLALCSIDLSLRYANPRLCFLHIRPRRWRARLSRARSRRDFLSNEILKASSQRERCIRWHSQKAFQLDKTTLDGSHLKRTLGFEPLDLDPYHVSIEWRRCALFDP
jgi:hypothetical protein